mmetsp:Transcript_1411/g.3067  ORF Transcript_1411/g.3067 Transcript_1411/m.3067 type:complete len:523 (+) Transcript_1411:68-1636(+)
MLRPTSRAIWKSADAEPMMSMTSTARLFRRRVFWNSPNMPKMIGCRCFSSSRTATIGKKPTKTSTPAAQPITDDKDLLLALQEQDLKKIETIIKDDDDNQPPSWQEHAAHMKQLMGESLQPPAGKLIDETTEERLFIPEVSLHAADGRHRKRILILCTGGTLTMTPRESDGALEPVEGALSAYMQDMTELHQNPNMPEYHLHEYTPFYDSSDLGPADWARVAQDIRVNYLHYDGFVVVAGTDTMAYMSCALSFMLENLGKPVVFTGSQIPLCEPYNDARRNLIMAMIFASRDTINEVTLFFHDRLLRACRSTKVNTHRLKAFDSPNMDPLARIGIAIDENEHLILPPPRGSLRVHSRMDTRLLTLRLVPGFDDSMIAEMIERHSATPDKKNGSLQCIVLQLYGTGNIPNIKESFIQILADAAEKGILVVASTQCYTGSVMLGHYAVGKALESAGVVSANDMTLEAIACKVGYLYGRGDLTHAQVARLMSVSLRGEVTPSDALSPPPLSSAYQRAIRKGKTYY